ncbi:hypothetical protein 1 [Wuhan arthropod virus 3]|uniref:hypothetical protein 1 n=1 Tax=Wuhan arthropod virus 3 TaxID=1923692 RepID=UPI000909A872|nr:hypothetical protein 1 [Wuhan arthropod virus 3]APG78404.1 hypothetical protein 1 [Wuhan arthropod virus 3]
MTNVQSGTLSRDDFLNWHLDMIFDEPWTVRSRRPRFMPKLSPKTVSVVFPYSSGVICGQCDTDKCPCGDFPKDDRIFMLFNFLKNDNFTFLPCCVYELVVRGVPIEEIDSPFVDSQYFYRCKCTCKYLPEYPVDFFVSENVLFEQNAKDVINDLKDLPITSETVEEEDGWGELPDIIENPFEEDLIQEDEPMLIIVIAPAPEVEVPDLAQQMAELQIQPSAEQDLDLVCEGNTHQCEDMNVANYIHHWNEHFTSRERQFGYGYYDCYDEENPKIKGGMDDYHCCQPTHSNASSDSTDGDSYWIRSSGSCDMCYAPRYHVHKRLIDDFGDTNMPIFCLCPIGHEQCLPECVECSNTAHLVEPLVEQKGKNKKKSEEASTSSFVPVQDPFVPLEPPTPPQKPVLVDAVKLEAQKEQEVNNTQEWLTCLIKNFTDTRNPNRSVWMSDILEILNVIKPINLIYHLSHLIVDVKYHEWKRVLARFTILSELYGFFWEMSDSLLFSCLQSIYLLINLAAHWFTSTPESSVEIDNEALIEQALNPPLLTVPKLSTFINCPPLGNVSSSSSQPPVIPLPDPPFVSFPKVNTPPKVVITPPGQNPPPPQQFGPEGAPWYHGISSYFGFDDKPTPALVKVISGAALFIAILCGGKILQNNTDLTKWLTALGTACRNFVFMKQSLGTLFEWIEAGVGSMMGVEMKSADELCRDALIDKVIAHQEQIRSLRAQISIRATSILMMPNAIRKLRKKQDDLLREYGQFVGKKIHLAAVSLMLKNTGVVLTLLEDLELSIQSSSAGKVQPATFWYYGKSGHGKSRGAGLIIEQLQKLHGVKLTTYSRNSTDEFCSEYVGQVNWLYDDFGARLDGLDHGELQAIYSPNTYRVPMADVESKGRCFSSHYCHVCSNKVKIDKSPVLADPKILDRRRDIVFEVTYDPKHLDDLKTQPDGSTKHDPEKVYYQMMDRDTLAYIGKKMKGSAAYLAIAKMMKKIADVRVAEFEQKIKAMDILGLDRLFDAPLENQAGFDFLHEGTYVETPMFLLVGPAGCRKTAVCKAAGYKLDDNLWDDITTSHDHFNQIYRRMTDTFGVESSGPVVLTANINSLDACLDQLPSTDNADAFLRRVKLIEFTYRPAGWFKGNYTASCLAADEQNFCKYVKITMDNVEITWEGLRKMLADARTEKVDTLDFSGTPTFPAIEADFVLKLDKNVSDFINENFNLQLGMGSAEILKGSRLSAMIKLVPLFNFLRDKMPNVESDLFSDYILAFNNAKIDTGVDMILELHDPTNIYVFILRRGEPGIAGYSCKEMKYQMRDGVLYQVVEGKEFKTSNDHYLKFFENYVRDLPEERSTGLAFIDKLPEKYKNYFSLFQLAVASFTALNALSTLWPTGKEVLKPEATGDISAGDNVNPLRSSRPPPKSNERNANEKPMKDNSLKEPRTSRPHKNLDPGYTGDVTNVLRGMVGENAYSGANRAPPKPMTEEAQVDPQSFAVRTKCMENVIELYYPSGAHCCYGLMVRDKVGFTVGHVGSDLCVKTNGELKPIVQIKRFTGRDGQIFKLEHGTSYPNIVKHLRPSPVYTDLTGCRGWVMMKNRASGQIYNYHVVLKGRKMEVRASTTGFTDETYVTATAGYTVGSMFSDAGDCGSPCFVSDTSINHKLIGLHAAANSSRAQLTSVFQSDFDDLVYEESSPDAYNLMTKDCFKTTDIKEYKLFEVIGKIQKDGQDIAMFKNNRTQLRKSPLSDPLYPNYHEPSLMHHGDSRLKNKKISLYEDAIDKWSNPQPEMDLELLDEVVDELADYYTTLARQRNVPPLKVLTTTESLNRYTKYAHSNPIQRQTSAGFPWKLHGYTTKMDLLEIDEAGLAHIAKHEGGTKLNTAVAQLIAAARNKIRPFVVFDVSLKDELLELKKIYDAPKTRSFAAAPIDYTIAHRKYFHAAVAMFAELKSFSPIKVGIDPVSWEWNDLFETLAANSGVGFDADFSGFDSTVPKAVMERLPKIYNALYQRLDPDWKPEDDVIRFWLHSALHGPLLTYHNYIVKAPGGQVSGQPATAVDNSLVNVIYWVYCFKRIMRRNNQPSSLYYFFLYVVLGVYGDDCLATIKQTILKFFNFNTMSAEMAALGIKMTGASKGGGLEPDFIPLTEMTFLKHSFKPVPEFNMFMAALDEKSIAKNIHWTRVRKSHSWDRVQYRVEFEPDTILSTVESLARNSLGLGPEGYASLRSVIIDKLSDLGIYYYYPTWDALFKQYYFGCLEPVGSSAT